MEYIQEVGGNIVKADEYLKELFYKLAPLYREKHGKNQDVVVPLFTSLHSTSESILILLLLHSLPIPETRVECREQRLTHLTYMQLPVFSSSLQATSI